MWPLVHIPVDGFQPLSSANVNSIFTNFKTGCLIYIVPIK